MAINQQYPSLLLEKAVGELSKLPGVGRKTALRLALHLLRQNESEVETFSSSILKMKQEIKHCSCCHNVSDTELCPICADARRDSSVVCVVENIQDVMAIENTQQYNGLYHVLGGVISPMDGIGPADIEIDSLVERVAQGGVKEIIFANFYISKRLANYGVLLTVIARGISVGNELEYTDEVTLGRSILNRTPFDK